MFSFQSIEQYHDKLRSGAFTVSDVLRHYLKKIEEEKELNAFIEVFEKDALERAAMLDKTEVEGPLHGVIIGIKDNICYKDHKSSAASKILQEYKSVYSATAVERLLEAGAIIIGRQNCDEFGMGATNENSFYGPVRNPQNKDLVAGGSSGGSAAAVAAGLCMISLGSDTGGSVRLPADYCGIVGYKPAYGRISRHGLIAYGSSFDQIGILALNANDVSIVLEAIAGPDEFDSTTVPEILDFSEHTSVNLKKIGFFKEWLDHPSIDKEISDAVYNKINQLRASGHEVEATSFPLTDYIVPAYYVLTTAEASSNLSRYDGARFGYQSEKKPENLLEFYENNRTEGFGFEVKKRILLGSFVLSTGYFDAYFSHAQRVRSLLRQQTLELFQKYEFILAPVSPKTAPAIGTILSDSLALYLGDIFTVYSNLVGIPAISLPVFKHSSNLTFGLQVLSSPHNEVSLLRFSHQLMQQ